MGCCGSKKKLDSDSEPEEPPRPAPEPLTKVPPREEPRTRTETLENQYQFQTPVEKPVEELGPRKETLEEPEEPSVSAVEVDVPKEEEECTPLPGSVDIAGRADVEPIEPVKIPFTSFVPKLGPLDKNHVVVRQQTLLSPAQRGPPSSQLVPESTDVSRTKNTSLSRTTDSSFVDQSVTALFRVM